MNLDFFNEFGDDYLQTSFGQGAFLAGVVLGYIAKCQDSDILSAPMYKQIQFGRLHLKGLKKLLARVPVLLKAYRETIRAPQLVSALAAEADKMLLQGGEKELGVNGNFAFTAGFANADRYFWKIFAKENKN